MRRVAAFLAVFAAGAGASRLLLQHVPHRFAADMMQPLPVATNWGTFGFDVWLVLMLTLGAASVLYVSLLRTLAARDGRFNVIAVLAASVIAMAVLWMFAPLLSSDAYAYAAYGEMARLGIDPYAASMRSSGDPLVAAAVWQWSGALPICVYGEAFVRIAQAIVSLFAPFGVRAQIDGMRALSSTAFLIAAWLLGRLRARDGKAVYTTALLAWNPVLLWCAVEGHNDALMLAVALGGIAVARRRLFAGMLLAALAALIKIPAAVVPAAIAYARARRTDEWVYPITYAIFVGAAIFAASTRWLNAVQSHVAEHGHYAPAASLQGLGATVFPPAVAAGFAVLVAAIAAFFFIRNATGAQRAIGLALALWLLIPNPYAWYGFWLVPLFAWLPGSRACYAAAGLTLCSMFRYVPDAFGAPSPALNAALSILALLFYAIAFSVTASRKTVPLL